MTQQYLRECRLTVGGGGGAIDLSQMRITFDVRQGDRQFPNYANIRIYNLSDKTAQAIRKEFKPVTLEAGYRGSIGTLFKGEILQVRIGRENPVDKYCHILATSADRAHNHAVVNKSLAAGHTFKDQVEACLEPMKAFGVTVGHIDDLGSKKMPRGRVLTGMSRDILRQVGFATGTSWCIVNGTFQMVKNTGTLPGDTVVLNSTTGLIGMPEQTIQGIVARCLLNTQIVPGCKVKIDQASIQQAEFDPAYKPSVTNETYDATGAKIAADGIYKVMVADHNGDTRGAPWYTDMICVNASQGITPALAARGIGTDDPSDQGG